MKSNLKVSKLYKIFVNLIKIGLKEFYFQILTKSIKIETIYKFVKLFLYLVKSQLEAN